MNQGIIQHLLRHSPPPEVPEINFLLGRSVVSHNESLWAEKSTLQDIVCEMSDMAPMHEASSSAVGSKKLSKAKIFRNAMTFSKLHYTDDVEVQYPIDAMEFLSVKQFDAEYVLQHLEHIRHLIDIENIDLERAIEDLQRIINGEDIHSAEVTPRGGSRDHTTTTALSSTSASSSSSSSLARASRPIPDVRFSQTLNSATLLKAKDNNPNHSRTHSSHSSQANHHPSQPKMTKTVSLSSSSASSSGMHRSSSMPNDVSFLADLDDPSVRPMSQPAFNNNSNNNNQTKSAESSPQQPQQQSSSSSTATTSRVSKFRGRLRDAQAELFLADDL